VFSDNVTVDYVTDVLNELPAALIRERKHAGTVLRNHTVCHRLFVNFEERAVLRGV